MIVYTTGYGGDKTYRGESKPATLKQLVEHLDAVLYDIRHVPWSKAPCWRKAYLAALLGDRYRHLPALGNANYNGQHGDGFRIVDLQYGLCQVLNAPKTPLLLCGCEFHDGCHRNYIAQHLAANVTDVVEILHWSAQIKLLQQTQEPRP